jgi:hypothetical protein
MKDNGKLKYVAAVIIGLIISAVDNYAFGGEITPMVVILLLLLSTSGMSVIVNAKAYLISIIIWFFLPAVHLIKHIFGLSDTIEPNTYQSILLLALVTFLICQIGFLVGRGIRKAINND